MILNPDRIPSRNKQILAGLFLSKFDAAGLKKLGFESFQEAFNVLGYALGGRPASIKNYRDEFDPMFPNPRKGWHKRKRRDYCLKLAKEYEKLKMPQFLELVRDFVGQPQVEAVEPVSEISTTSADAFARRLVTGLAAEQYFQTYQPTIAQLRDFDVEDTTRQGCGYDFRLWPRDRNDFLAVEVKGIAERSGSISLTAKEHQTATDLSDRFILFVVKNFKEKPFHEIHYNPIAGPFQFSIQKRIVTQISWLASA